MNEYLGLLNELNCVCSDMDKQFDMNSGGCLYCAYCLSKFFDLYHIDYTVLMSMYEDAGLEDTPYHVSLKVKDVVINPSIYDDGFIREYSNELMNHKNLMILYKRWNDYASELYKKYHNTDIHKTIKNVFEKYKSLLNEM